MALLLTGEETISDLDTAIYNIQKTLAKCSHSRKAKLRESRDMLLDERNLMKEGHANGNRKQVN